jgi:hypothetical protein
MARNGVSPASNFARPPEASRRTDQRRRPGAVPLDTAVTSAKIECSAAIVRKEEMLRALRAKRKWVLVTLGLVIAGAAATIALATPGSGVSTTTFVSADFTNSVHVNSDRVKFQTKDPTTVRVQKLVWTAGAFSGWHHHPGVIIVTVQSGSVTVEDSNCNSVTYGPGLPDGAVFVEGGDDPIQVTSAGGATEYAMQVSPAANPPVFMIEYNPPACAS